MKKIHFGYSNDNNPTGMFEGIGASPNKDIIDSEYIDFIELNGRVYLVSKISMVFSGEEERIGKIDVREVIADLYKDGSGVLFADQEKSYICTSLEKSLSNAKEFLDRGTSVKHICGAYNAPDSFNFLLNRSGDYPLLVTGIKHEAFETKRKLISMCRDSFSNIQRELQEAYAKLEEYKNAEKNGRSFKN